MRLPKLLSLSLAAIGGAALSTQALAGPDRHDDAPIHRDDHGADYHHRDYGDLDHRDRDHPDRDHEHRGAHGHPGHSGPWPHYPSGPMPGPWMPHCADDPNDAPAACVPYYPAMTYAVPMMMVPVLRQKPCPEEVVEEWIEEPAPVRRRLAPPRRVNEKRILLTPDKRVKTKRVPE